MALIQYGPMVAQSSGKLGGTVFSRNAAGDYARQKVSPVQPRSQAQLNIRCAMTYCAIYWRDTMTADQRATWNMYATATPMPRRLGARKPISGIAMFLRFNAVHNKFGGAPLVTMTSSGGEANACGIGLSATAATGVNIAGYSILVGANDHVLVSASAYPVSQARNFFNGPWKDKLWAGGTPTFPLNVIPPALCAIGQRWYIRTRLFEAIGRVSPTYQAYVDILT